MDLNGRYELISDAVSNAPVRLDREVRNNRVDDPFVIIGAPLWSLSLIMNFVIY